MTPKVAAMVQSALDAFGRLDRACNGAGVAPAEAPMLPEIALAGSWAATLVTVIPAQRAARGKAGLLDEADDLERPGGGVPHARSAPAAMTPFFK